MKLDLALRRRRKFTNSLVLSLSFFAAVLGIFSLTWILWEVIARGIASINWDFFTKQPTPTGIKGGGLGPAIMGTLMITGLSTLLAVPAGLLAGIFMSEFGRDSKFTTVVRFLSNALMGTPSIIMGLFIYALVVVPMGNYSGLAGALSLAIIMLPVIARTSEDLLNLVPNALRESALALGAPRWKMILDVVLRAAKAGLLTGVLLAIARVSGETAPLLFTSLNSKYWMDSLLEPTANLTVSVYNDAMSSFEDLKQRAWGGALLITSAVLFTNVFARSILLKGNKRK